VFSHARTVATATGPAGQRRLDDWPVRL